MIKKAPSGLYYTDELEYVISESEAIALAKENGRKKRDARYWYELGVEDPKYWDEKKWWKFNYRSNQ